MTKRLIEIDDDVLTEAQRVLATTSMTATVNEALREAVRAHARRQHLLALGGSDLHDPEVMAGAWR